ncbi:uncharacterized protein BDV14DRAFT_167825 [Aspergillus stella-maris]|uniref:uncharacterized protein n=1 Tax=Aspergillus stella-maris TaxID=1810926 RepID=UPI003CCE25D7
MMFPRSTFLILLVLSFYVLGVQSTYYLPIKGPAKYEQWLPLLTRRTLQKTSERTCNATLALYKTQWEHSGDRLDKTCQAHMECILNSMSENAKAYMSSSSLLLGLSPVLLSTLGPSISEIGLLSLNRPVLAVMLSLGTVAIYPSRALAYNADSCHEILDARTILPVSVFNALNRRPGLAFLVSAAEYIIIAFAVFNVFYTSWQLGVATVLNFICQSSFMPIIWTSLPLLIHLPAALAFRFNLTRAAPTRTPGPGSWIWNWNLLHSRLTSETKLSMNHKPIPSSMFTASPTVLACHWIATLFGFVHVIFGILIYSSLLFTMTTDAAVILLRYFASALACRFVLIFELAGVKWARGGGVKNNCDGRTVSGGAAMTPETEYVHLREIE